MRYRLAGGPGPFLRYAAPAIATSVATRTRSSTWHPQAKHQDLAHDRAKSNNRISSWRAD